MPVIHVHIWEGRSDEQVAEIIKGITDVFVKMGTPAEAVRVLVHTLPKTHWGKEGKPSSEL